MNLVSLVGRLVYEPETKQTSNGKTYLPMRIAVSRNDKDKTFDFLNCRAWNQTAEFISKYFHKGDPIEVSGKLRCESYEKQDGTKVTETYVLVSEVSFVPAKPKTEQNAQTEPPKDVGLPFEL